MRQHLLLLLLLFFIGNLHAQDTTAEIESTSNYVPKHEFGVNVTQFFKQLISFNELTINDPNAYAIIYKYWYKPNRSLRFGANINSTTFKRSNDFGNSITQQSTVSSYEALLGFVFSHYVSKKWLTYFSIDATYEFGKLAGEQNGIQIADQITNVVGGGPVLGLQFYVTSKISIGTEMSLYYKYEIADNGFTADTPSGPQEITTTGKTSSIDLNSPASLYFSFKF